MARYSFQSRDRIFVKGYGFLSFAKNLGKISVKKIVTIVVNIVRNFLIMLNSLLQMHLELLQKEQFEKQQKQLVI